MTGKWKTLAVVLLLPCAIVFRVFLTTALANEIWVTPAAPDAANAAGDWSVTNNAVTRFSFGIPDSMTGFVAAKVVILGKVAGAATYDLHLSLSKDQDGAKVFHRFDARHCP